MNKNKNIALTGILLAVTVCLSFVESIISLPVPVPGVKIGLASVPVMFCLFRRDTKTALFLCIVKSALYLTARGITTFWISLCGGLLSFAVMFLMFRKLRASILLTSAAGAVSHNFGQVAAAAVLFQNIYTLYYAPVLAAVGVVTGIFTGCCAAAVMKLSK